MTSQVRIRILGPLEVSGGGRPVPVTAPKQRAILALLAANAGRVVRVESLVTELWGDEPPKSAVANLRTYVMQLRKLLFSAGSGELVTTEAGYLLRIDADEIDLRRFEAALERADKAMANADLAAGEAALHEALSFWRGDFAENVEPGPALRNFAARLGEQYAGALEDHAETKLALGDHVAAIDRLRDLVERYPLRERAYGRLMLALYRRGDVDGALAVYVRAAKVLAEELGLEPGPELSALHQAILRRDPELVVPGDEPVRPRAARPPRELPRNPGTFVGRAAELDRVEAVVRTAGPTPPVVVIHGPGGIGKSALALRAAHAVADAFPDGHLYVDLQGATPGLAALDPAEALARFLRALGVPQAELPATRAEAATRFQSMLAARRVLLVLDNAASAAQVGPLLPAGAGCAVLVTSRAVLPTLDAEPVALGVLDEAAAVRLLALAAGTRPVTADRDLAVEVARRCGCHPLALRIAGARLAGRPDWSPARFAERLADQRRRLDELRVDDLDVRSCFAVSYEALDTGADPGARRAARVFQLLGTLDVPEFGTELVAALAGTDVPTAEDALGELVSVRLAEVVTEGRFTVHDLLRLYAAELAERELTPGERRLALERAWAWYLARCRDSGGEAAWLDTELPGLVSAAVQAVAPARFAIDLHAAVKPLATKRGYWRELEVLARLALDVGARIGDTAAQRLALTTAAAVDWRAGRAGAAREAIRRGLELARAAGAVEDEARAWHNLGWLEMRRGDVTAALGLFTWAIELLGDRPEPRIAGFVRHNLAEALLLLDRADEAVACFELSLAARRSCGDGLGESITLAGLGRAHCLLGRPDEALAVFAAAERGCREAGNREDEWEVLLCRSAIRLRRGEIAAATADLDRAAELAAQVGAGYGRAAVERQLAAVLRAGGDDAGAAAAGHRAAALFAAPGIQVDPVLERVLGKQL
ncbi:tetratricopeptide repeat protein [Amycolatopsis sp. H6(2020)]|nr:tetratricopeptide repeat protein [Amycolatopsis sp. H6(2020)]